MSEAVSSANKTELPNSLKKCLIDLGTTFSGWCRHYGFQRVTARNVAAGIIQGKRGDSKKILEALQKDFPEIFGTEKCLQEQG